MKAAILGLGIIGSQWAKHLYSDGILSASWNRSPVKASPLFENNFQKVADNSEILHICVSDPAAVDSILQALFPFLNHRHLVIQSSTIDPSSSLKFKNFVEKSSASYLEAPFTGSLPAAESRELIFYLGGLDSVIEKAQPYLLRLSKKTVIIGNEKQAATLKLVMNLQIASAMQALAEALTISRLSGINDQVFFDAFRLNASFSGVAALKEMKLKQADFSPQFSVKHMAKDLRLLRAEYEHANAPFLGELQKVFVRAQELSLSDEDFSALIKLCN